MPSPIELVIKHFSEHYKDKAHELTVKLWLYLKQGYSLNKAVNQAMIDTGLLSYFHDEVKSTIADSAAKGAEIEKLPLLKPLTKPWDAGGLTLSQKLHSADKTIIAAIKNTIQAQFALNSGVRKTARALYDGYNHPTHVMMQQRLPIYIDKIAQYVRRADLSLEERQLLLRLCRRTKAKTERLSQNGAPTKALKTAYNQLLDAVEQGQEHAMKRAVKTAVEEKSRYTAERLARTEAARAWQDGFLARYADNERVAAYKWHLSSRHPVFDICDMYAKADLYGLGKGIFPKDKVPKIPVHPHCMCYLSPVYKSELKGRTERDLTKEEGDKWLKTLPPLELYKVMGIKGREAWKKGEDWRKYARNYDITKTNNRLINVNLYLKDIYFMSGRFKPKYDKEIDINLPGTKTLIPIKRVINSNFNLWAEKSETQRSMPIKICEKILNRVQPNLPKILEIPQIIIVDFDKYNINSSAIGGHDPKTGNIFINAKYRSEKSIADYLTKNEGFFASMDITAPYLHELGHRYYNLVIEKIADKRQISYNRARNLIEDSIKEYIKQYSKINYEIIEQQISRYAYDSFNRNFSEIIAEAFSIKDIKRDIELIKYIFDILSEGE